MYTTCSSPLYASVCVCVCTWVGWGGEKYVTLLCEYLLYSTTSTTTVQMDLCTAFILMSCCCAKCCVIVHAAWRSVEECAPSHALEECRFVHIVVLCFGNARMSTGHAMHSYGGPMWACVGPLAQVGWASCLGGPLAQVGWASCLGGPLAQVCLHS